MNPEEFLKEKKAVLEETDVAEFIRRRGVAPEDFYLIEELAKFPKNLITQELHNLFNLNKERSPAVLESLIAGTKSERRKRLYELTLKFAKKYDWATGMNLVAVLERRKTKFTVEDLNLND